MLYFIKALLHRYSEDDIAGRAAALSYYTIFSIGPLLFVIFGVLGQLLKNEEYKQRLLDQMQELVGPQAGLLINDVITNQTLSGKTTVSFAIGIIGLILGAIGIFGQLQKSIDRILHVKIGPDAGLKPIVKQRLISLGMVGVIIFVLIVSLVASAAISFLTSGMTESFITGFLLRMSDFIVSVIILSLLLSVFYRILPDIKVPWRPLFIASLVVAVLFSIGKIVLGIIIGNNSNITAFGAAGSLIALLLWVFYSGQIVFLGAAGLSLYIESNDIEVEPKYKGKRGVVRLKQTEEPVIRGVHDKVTGKIKDGLRRGWTKNFKP